MDLITTSSDDRENKDSEASNDTPKSQVDTVDYARDAALKQHELTLSQAIKYYRPAIGWSFLFSLGVIMAGFDPQLVGTLVAIPTFQRDFGVQLADGSYVVAAQWQSAFNLGVPVGQVVGSIGVGWPLEKYGRKWTLAGCCIITCIAVSLQASAQNKPQILIAELVNGVVIGAYPVIAPTYISEVTPVVFRGICAAFINLSFVIGQFVASGILAGTQDRTDRWSYDIPFLCQFIFPIIILIALPFCPESPWHLVRKGKTAEAEKSLRRLMHPSMDVKATLAHIQLTTELELQEVHTANFIDCFKGTERRRTIISSMVYAIQPLAGNFLVIGYAVYFFELAGLATGDAFHLGVGLLAVGFVGTCLSWPLIAKIGRRKIYNYGLVLLTVILLLIGILDCIPNYSSNTNLAYGQSSLMVIYNFFYDMTIGPLCFVIISETSSAKLRGKTIAISTCINALINVGCAVGIPYALNPDQGNLRGKLAFVFFGLTIPCLGWCFTSLPETKGRTFDELDLMFHRQVPTKDFKTYTFEGESGTAFDDNDAGRPHTA
jgi:SP family general alpha glucoside:H+ symporter-like MFS transporter